MNGTVCGVSLSRAIAANVVSIVFRVQIVDATDATWKLVIILLCT